MQSNLNRQLLYIERLFHQLKRKKGSISASVIVFFLLAGLITTIEKKLDQLTRPPRKEIKRFPEQYNLNYRNLQIQTKNNKLLSGWLIDPSENGGHKTNKVVFICHGYGMNRSGYKAILESIVKDYIENGVACVLFDFENHGLINGKKTSDDGLTTIGAKTEQENLHAVTDFVKYQLKNESNSQFEYTDISYHGYSMGAATAAAVAAQRDDVQMVFLDSCFTDLEKYLIEQIAAWDKHVKPWMIKPLLTYVKYTKGLDVSTFRPIDEVRKLGARGVAVRFIHTEGDQVTPEIHSIELAQAYLEAYNNQAVKQPLTIENVLMLTNSFSKTFGKSDTKQKDHCRSMDVDLKGYKQFAINWISEHLGTIEIQPPPADNLNGESKQTSKVGKLLKDATRARIPTTLQNLPNLARLTKLTSAIVGPQQHNRSR